MTDVPSGTVTGAPSISQRDQLRGRAGGSAGVDVVD